MLHRDLTHFVEERILLEKMCQTETQGTRVDNNHTRITDSINKNPECSHLFLSNQLHRLTASISNHILSWEVYNELALEPRQDKTIFGG